MVKTKIMNEYAEIENGIWSCDKPSMLDLLTAATELYREFPPQHVADFDRGCARHLVDRFGGEIISMTCIPESAPDELHIY